MFGQYPSDENGIQRTNDEIIVLDNVPSKLLEVLYFDDEWRDIDSVIHSEEYCSEEYRPG